MVWLSQSTGRAVATVTFILIALLVVVAALRSRNRPALATVGIVGFVGLALALLWPLRSWLVLVAVVPAALVLYQALTLWQNQPTPGSFEPPWLENHSAEWFTKGAATLGELVRKYYGPQELITRYGIPAGLLLAEGIVIPWALTGSEGLLAPATCTSAAYWCTALAGASYGAVGAYVQVLITLGRRAMRSDITPGSATWGAISLLLGPLVSGTLALIFRIGPTDQGQWAIGTVLFFAGYAPLRIVAVIEQSALQLLKAGDGRTRESRLIPLGRLRGIDEQIEGRLAEEGIVDVHSLAYADAIRLVRNTAFDLRQIVAWMDEALLIIYSPKAWSTLEEAGITGAIDLAWMHMGSSPPDVVATAAAFEALAKETKMEAPALRLLASRVFYDEQVRRIWILYNTFVESGASPNGGPGSTPVPPAEPSLPTP